MHAKYEVYTSNGSKVIAKVKQTDEQTDRQTNRKTGQKQYAPDHTIRGHKKALFAGLYSVKTGQMNATTPNTHLNECRRRWVRPSPASPACRGRAGGRVTSVNPPSPHHRSPPVCDAWWTAVYPSIVWIYWCPRVLRPGQTLPAPQLRRFCPSRRIVWLPVLRFCRPRNLSLQQLKWTEGEFVSLVAGKFEKFKREIFPFLIPA